MPELPEVETTRRGIQPWVEGQQVESIVVRQPKLRWPIPEQLSLSLPGQRVQSVTRRAKYLLFQTDAGVMLVHLGMSGSLCIVPKETEATKHAHVDIGFSNGMMLRYTDPRRFGAVLWQADSNTHPLLDGLGPEPLDEGFSSEYFLSSCRMRKLPIKQLLMNNAVVVGIGNIYASEALFRAGIDPRRAANRIAEKRLEVLRQAVISVLSEAIEQGGTTLKDFIGGDGKPGYFQQQLKVYGRVGETCFRCGTSIRSIQLGQRSTYFCVGCQR